MNSRSLFTVVLGSTTYASSSTISAAGSAIDLGDYFPVGKRSVKFIVACANQSTLTATLALQECASTATASFTTCLGVDGSTLSYTIPVGTTLAPTSTFFEVEAVVEERYVRYSYAQAVSTDVLKYSTVMVAALPLIRVG